MELLEVLEETEVQALKTLSTRLGMKFEDLVKIVTGLEIIPDSNLVSA